MVKNTIYKLNYKFIDFTAGNILIIKKIKLLLYYKKKLKNLK